MSLTPSSAITNTANADVGTIRIFIVGAQNLFVAGLRSLIQGEPGLTVVGAVARLGDLNALNAKPDVILFEHAVGKNDNFDSVPALIQAVNGARILVVADVIDKEIQNRAVNLGAKGVIGATELPGRFFEAIRKVHGGGVWVNLSASSPIIQKVDLEKRKLATLTKRELQVIYLLCDGLKNRQIAEHLLVSECTVRHHLSSIFGKLELADRLELIIYAYRHGLASVLGRHSGVVA